MLRTHGARAIAWITDLVFPVRCLGCGSFAPPLHREYLCRSCFSSIATSTKLECIGCGAPAPEGATCPPCRRNGRYVDQLTIAAPYDQPLLRRAIHAYKYQFIQSLASPLSRILLKGVGRMAKEKGISVAADTPLVVAVPLTPYRTRWRGFHHTALLADHFARVLLLPTHHHALARKRGGQPQTEMANRDTRLGNVTGAFAADEITPVRNRSVLLVDDVCTTGATLNECAKVLKQYGAEHVSALVVARG